MKPLPLQLGPNAIARIIPHRAPLALVSAVSAYSSAGPMLWANRVVDASEPVLAGHFPGRPLWPGAYTIEGLAQCAALVLALARWEREADSASAFEARLAALGSGDSSVSASGGGGLLAAVEVKLTRPVQVGDRLDYEVEVTHAIGELVRLRVEASVAGRSVARGTLTVAPGLGA